ncbi:MAG: sugar kinase [Candidatus Aminicenantes bacterium RBG_16_63_16]|nr:MAG: sugar kinase [Candidatus Aminicenantes bacterium RBG_16_63_16]
MDDLLMNKPIIGVDLGGTKVNAGRVENGRVAAQASAPVDSRGSEQEILDSVAQTIARVFTPDVAGIGVGVPSVVDIDRGIVYDVQNIPSWKEVPLGRVLAVRFERPVYINNDANCFAAGEKHFGKGKPFRHFAGVTLGTGLGAGLIIDGRLYSGVNCGAGEFGMIPYGDSILEHYASGQYFERRYGIRGEEAQARAERGDPEAVEIFRRFGAHVGDAVTIIMLAVDPQAVILGGSVSRAFHLFEAATREKLAAFPYHKSVERIVIETSSEPQIAILGAAALYLDARHERM